MSLYPSSIFEDERSITISRPFYDISGNDFRIINENKDIIVKAPIINTGKVSLIGKNVHIKHLIITNSRFTLIAKEKYFFYTGIPFSKPSKDCLIFIQAPEFAHKIVRTKINMLLIEKIKTFLKENKNMLHMFTDIDVFSQSGRKMKRKMYFIGEE